MVGRSLERPAFDPLPDPRRETEGRGVPQRDTRPWRCVSDAGRCADIIAIGLFNGLIIALIALGYTLVYGILQLINFANGEVFMIGTLLTFFWLGCSSRMASGRAQPAPCADRPAGHHARHGRPECHIERLAYRPLRNAPTLATLISAIGMSFVLQNVGIVLLGPSPMALRQILRQRRPRIQLAAPIGSASTRSSSAAVTIPLLFALVWFVQNTRQGKAMRATAQDREAAGLMGIDVNRTIGLTFLLAGALAGGAGLVVALFNGQAQWSIRLQLGLLAFTAAVLGGIGNLAGADLGGIVLGHPQGPIDFYVEPRWTDVIVFSMLVIVLVFRPTGLLGEKQAEGS